MNVPKDYQERIKLNLSLFQSFNAINNLNQSNNTKHRNFGLSSSHISKSSIAAVNNFTFVVSSYDLC